MQVIDGKQYTEEHVRNTPKLWRLLTHDEKARIFSYLHTKEGNRKVSEICSKCGKSYQCNLSARRNRNRKLNTNKTMCQKCRYIFSSIKFIYLEKKYEDFFQIRRSTMSSIWLHPFKEGIYGILRQHFDDSIVKNFILEFETEIYNNESIHVWRQKKDNNLILEVRYRVPDGLTVYVCDVRSWESRKQTEYHLLKFITDKVKEGKFGQDWIQVGSKLGVSEIIKSGELETKEVI